MLTSGRFHMCDLARELDAAGHEVAFYSCVPPFRTRQFGLPDRCAKSLFWCLGPLLALMRRCQNTPLHFQSETLLNETLDRLVSMLVPPCDVFIGMSGMSSRTARAVRRKYRAQVWIERGSRHILSQKAILEGIAGGNAQCMPRRTVERELADYEIADTVVVPSRHVEQSFEDFGFPKARLFRNPYGVDLAMFPPTQKPSNERPVVIFVGTWSLRKGCDLLWDACRLSQSWKLVHVGSIGDAVVPQSSLFEHRDPVPQWRLSAEFRRADVFALSSREEGLSLVQAQALASGLPIVCTDRTGGEDLRSMLTDPHWITVVPTGDAIALQWAIEKALALGRSQTGVRDVLGADREKLSWRAYGQRYTGGLAARTQPKNLPLC